MGSELSILHELLDQSRLRFPRNSVEVLPTNPVLDSNLTYVIFYHNPHSYVLDSQFEMYLECVQKFEEDDKIGYKEKVAFRVMDRIVDELPDAIEPSDAIRFYIRGLHQYSIAYDQKLNYC